MLLELDLATIGWQILNFLLLSAVLYYLLFRPVLANIQARAEEEVRAKQQLEETRASAAVLKTELEQRLAALDDEADRILSQAREKAEVDRQALLRETHAEVEQVLAEAHVDAYRLKRQAIDEFHGELLSAILDVSGLLIERVAPAEVHAALVQQLFDTIWELGRSDMGRVEALRRGLGERTPTVIARSAKALSLEQQGQLVRTLSALADRNINLDLRVDPGLGLGIRVRLGDLLMDNTVAGKLTELRSTVESTLQERLADDRSATRQA